VAQLGGGCCRERKVSGKRQNTLKQNGKDRKTRGRTKKNYLLFVGCAKRRWGCVITGRRPRRRNSALGSLLQTEPNRSFRRDTRRRRAGFRQKDEGYMFTQFCGGGWVMGSWNCVSIFSSTSSFTPSHPTPLFLREKRNLRRN
jgi:hypothetical protein